MPDRLLLNTASRPSSVRLTSSSLVPTAFEAVDRHRRGERADLDRRRAVHRRVGNLGRIEPEPPAGGQREHQRGYPSHRPFRLRRWWRKSTNSPPMKKIVTTTLMPSVRCSPTVPRDAVAGL